MSPNKILFKKQESFLPGLSLLRVGQKEQCCISCVLFRGRAGRCSAGFGVTHSSLSPWRGDMIAGDAIPVSQQGVIPRSSPVPGAMCHFSFMGWFLGSVVLEVLSALLAAPVQSLELPAQGCSVTLWPW